MGGKPGLAREGWEAPSGRQAKGLILGRLRPDRSSPFSLCPGALPGPRPVPRSLPDQAELRHHKNPVGGADSWARTRAGSQWKTCALESASGIQTLEKKYHPDLQPMSRARVE